MPNASHVTVVVEVGKETFRFPFLRNPNARAKFGDPDSVTATAVANTTPAVILEQQKQAKTVERLSDSSPSKAISSQQFPANSPNSSFDKAKPPNCSKNISFAVAEDGQVVPRVPSFVQKWTKKNERKYSGLCFSQSPNPQVENYLLVFSTSQSAFNGLYPTVHTTTNTSTTPVSGSGSITDYYGGMWQYTFTGTVTTTTTTTEHLNLPYTDTSDSLYLNSYGQNGRRISERWRTITTRQGGDGMNTLGYNLGALLTSIHIKERLLKDAIKDVQADAISKAPTSVFSEHEFVPPPSTPRISELAQLTVVKQEEPTTSATTPTQKTPLPTESQSPVKAQPEPESLGDVARHYRELKQKPETESPQQ